METITLSDEIISSLKKIQRKNESLVDIIARLVEDYHINEKMKKQIRPFEGMEKETEEIREEPIEKNLYCE